MAAKARLKQKEIMEKMQKTQKRFMKSQIMTENRSVYDNLCLDPPSLDVGERDSASGDIKCLSCKQNLPTDDQDLIGYCAYISVSNATYYIAGQSLMCEPQEKQMNYRIHIQTCHHTFHKSCFQSFQKQQMFSHSYGQREFYCSLCKKMQNIFIPNFCQYTARQQLSEVAVDSEPGATCQSILAAADNLNAARRTAPSHGMVEALIDLIFNITSIEQEKTQQSMREMTIRSHLLQKPVEIRLYNQDCFIQLMQSIYQSSIHASSEQDICLSFISNQLAFARNFYVILSYLHALKCNQSFKKTDVYKSEIATFMHNFQKTTQLAQCNLQEIQDQFCKACYIITAFQPKLIMSFLAQYQEHVIAHLVRLVCQNGQHTLGASDSEAVLMVFQQVKPVIQLFILFRLTISLGAEAPSDLQAKLSQLRMVEGEKERPLELMRIYEKASGISLSALVHAHLADGKSGVSVAQCALAAPETIFKQFRLNFPSTYEELIWHMTDVKCSKCGWFPK